MIDKKNARYILAVSFFAFLIFWCQFGLKILHPSYYMWLMGGDPAQHWLGWSLFRSTPLLQWPLGANYNFGMDVGNSIVYTDSIPLLAIPLKYILWFYHGDVQYTGWWILICCILNSLSGYAIVCRLTDNRIYAVIVSVFFAMSPVFIARALGHYALSAHWIILCAVYLMMDKQFRLWLWIGLMLIAITVHAYLFAMVFPVFAIKCFIERKQYGNTKSALAFLLCLVLVAFVMYAVGYFTISAGMDKGGYTIYNADLFSMLLVRSGIDSQLFGFLTKIYTPTSIEGFNFIGTAPLLALMFSIIIIACHRESAGNIKILLERSGKPIVVIFALMAIYAVSTRLSIFGNDIFNIEPPKILRKITSTFRASGRFTWPIMYLLVIFIFCFIEKSTAKLAVPLALLFVVVGLSDASNKYQSIHARYNEPYHKKYEYNAKWNLISAGDRIVSTNPCAETESWMKMAFISYRNGASLGFGYFAREDKNKIDEMKRKAINDINKNTTKDGYVYIVHKDNVTPEAWERIQSSKGYNIIDGIMVYKNHK